MGNMYRSSEMKLFNILSAVANLLVLLSLVLILLYHFQSRSPLNQKTALITLIFSGFFKVQIFMYKVVILEKRLLHLIEPSLQHFRVAVRRENLDLVVYFVFFWATLIGITFAFIGNPNF